MGQSDQVTADTADTDLPVKLPEEFTILLVPLREVVRRDEDVPVLRAQFVPQLDPVLLGTVIGLHFDRRRESVELADPVLERGGPAVFHARLKGEHAGRKSGSRYDDEMGALLASLLEKS
jgi:hypothetical protein